LRQLAQVKAAKTAAAAAVLLLSCCHSHSLVKRAMHGTRMMGWQEIRQFYGREVVNLRNEGRWVFLNTLFSVSEAVMYMQVRVMGWGGGAGWVYAPAGNAAQLQCCTVCHTFGTMCLGSLGSARLLLAAHVLPAVMQGEHSASPVALVETCRKLQSFLMPVLLDLALLPCCCCCCCCCVQLVDRLDQGAFSSGAPGQLTYQGLYRLVSKALYRAHVEGKLKREIIQVG
jgi:hypothetical protein